LEGQYSNPDKYHCACQKILILSKDITNKIKNIKLELPKKEMKEIGKSMNI